MQKQYNELEILISEAFRKSDPSYLGNILSIIYNNVDLRTCTLKKVDIEKLNRLSYKADSISNYYSVGLAYDHILSLKLIDVTSMSSDVLLAMANSLIPVLENIRGTSLSIRIGRYIRALFYLLLERPETPEEEKTLINSLLEGENLKPDGIFGNFEENEDTVEIMKLSKSKSLQDKITAVIRLMDLFTNCHTMQEQMEVFSRKTLNILKFVVSGTNESCYELFEIIGTFMETVIFQSEYLVRMDRSVLDLNNSIESDLNSFIFTYPPQTKRKLTASEVVDTINKEFADPKPSPKVVISYNLIEQEGIIKQVEGLYTVVSFVLNIFILYPKCIELQLMSIRILERLYNYFPNLRKQMQEPIITFFSHITSETSEDIKKHAAVFLYKLMHQDTSQDFKNELEAREGVKALFSSPHYNSSVLTVEHNEAEIVDIEDLHIRAGSPFNVSIDAGTVKMEYIEVWQPYSLITFGFATLQYDIAYSLERVVTFKSIMQHKKEEAFPIIKNGKIDSSQHPIRGTILIKEPGIYCLTFDNKSSWFNSKTVRFRLLVLTPNYEETQELNSREEAIFDETLGVIPLPSDMFTIETQSALDSSRDHISTNASMAVVPKGPSEILALIYLNKEAVEFNIVGDGKEYEIKINYDNEQIDWERINSRVVDVLKKMVDLEGSQDDGRLVLQLVYDEIVIEKLLKQDRFTPNFFQLAGEFFYKNLKFLEKVKKLLKGGKAQVLTELEFQVARVLTKGTAGNFANFILLVLDHSTQKIYGKLRKENRQIMDVNLDPFAVPIEVKKSEEDEHTIVLQPAEDLVFETSFSEMKRAGYLAFLIHTIFCFTMRSVPNIVIIEDVQNLFAESSNNRQLLNKALDSFYKKVQEGEQEPQNPLKIHFVNESKESNIKI